MSLQEERTILKQIHKLKLLQNQINEFMEYDRNIKSHKETMGQLRTSLKEQRSSIATLKTELSSVSMAVELGCDIGQLVGTKLECPPDSVGRVIGKKGKNLQQLMKTTNTNVDVEKTQVRLVGTLDSLEVAKTNLEKTITRTEQSIQASADLIKYLTSPKIALLQTLRDKHPDVWFQVHRNDTSILARGTPKDIESLQTELQQLELVRVEYALTTRESGLVVGKGGSNVARLVEQYQVSIDVEKTGDNQERQETSTTTIIGPINNVALVKTTIDTLMSENKEMEVLVPIHEYAKTVLLLQSGAGIQALQKKVNQDVDGFLPVNFTGPAVSIKGRAKYMENAERIVREEVQRVESQIRRVKMDPVAIPVIIGKKGEGIKELRDDTQVAIEVNRDTGEVAVCGLDEKEVESVQSKVEAVVASNQVRRISLDCESKEEFSNRYRGLLRSSDHKQVRDLVFILGDDDARQIVLRGEAAKLDEAKTIVEQFFIRNFTQELSVTDDDLTALLTGGKKSKIVDLANDTSVNLHTDRDRQVVIARGEKEKVAEAMKRIREYLYGSGDVVVRKIDLERSELMGAVIGRGGKTKMELQEKFPSLSILVPRGATTITLRGNATEARKCEVDIMKLVAAANVTRTRDLDEHQLQKLRKSGFNRRLGPLAKVAVTLSSEKSNITVRGTHSACEEALTLLKEEIEGVYETRMKINSLYSRLKAACSNPAHLSRIMQESSATVSINDETSSIVIHGTREQVQQAKESLLTYLGFLFGENIHRFACETQLLPIIATPSTIAEVSVLTGATMMVDKQIASVLVLSPDAEKVKAAVAILEDKARDSANLLFTLQLDESEDWIIAKIIGPKGSTIGKLRKSTGCDIQVASKERRVVVFGEDSDAVTKAGEAVNALVETVRKECVFVSLSEKHLPAFVGRAGSNITEFSKKHGVDVQIMKQRGNAVRITGDATKVTEAVDELNAWIDSRAAEQTDVQTKKVPARKVASVIGPKGAVIKSLRKDFKCRIELDSVEGIISVRDASEETVQALFAKIDEIVRGEEGESETKQLEQGQVPALIGTKGATITALQKEFGCKLDVDRDTAVLSIRGLSDDNREALFEKINSIVSREGENDEENLPVETKQLKADNVFAVIGARGAVINNLQREFRCKIDIDKATFVLSVRGGTAEAREALFAKIDRLIEGREDESADNEQKTVSNDKPIVEKENQPNKTTLRNKNQTPTDDNTINQPMQESDFPTLASFANPTIRTEQPAASGTAWSSIVSDPLHDPTLDLDLMD